MAALAGMRLRALGIVRIYGNDTGLLLKAIRITELRLISKSGGKSGDYQA